ncbi:MAG: macro domain-containing protein [Clostridiales bacterium]|nr:macro domain-containing protein [Clostridiales bacterium]
MSSISIKKISITELATDAVVNAANSRLAGGSGVCGAIFREAGWEKMEKACDEIGGCPTGKAVITPGFDLPAKYVIHAVGPMWSGGSRNEPELLYSAYENSLKVAKENGCHSIGFPLISAGIFGYPHMDAWKIALTACNDFIKNDPGYDIEIIFAVLDKEILAKGQKVISEIK